MTGKELMQRLRGAMTDIAGEFLVRNKRLAIGREILNEDPHCDASEIVSAYRNYGFTVEKARGQSPEAIMQMMERQEWISATLAKIEQIHRDGEYHPDKLKAQDTLPPEERVAPVKPAKPKDAGIWQDVPEDDTGNRPGIDRPGMGKIETGPPAKPPVKK